MNRLHRFLRLSAGKRLLLAETVIRMLVFRLGLWLVPFPRLATFIKRGRTLPNDVLVPERIAWSVRVVSRYVPKATCLVQALTAKAMLAKAGFPASLYIGVARRQGVRFEAHAWIEVGGKVITGGDKIECYSPLLHWKDENARELQISTNRD